MRREAFEALRVSLDEVPVEEALADEHVRDRVEERQIALWPQREMPVGLRRGLRAAGVDHHQRRVVRIPGDVLPQDRVRDAGVRTDEHQHVALLEVCVREGRGVEAEALLVGDHRRGHALARVPVPVSRSHPELREGAEVGHLLEGDLPRAQEGHGVGPVLGLEGFHAGAEDLRRLPPVDGTQHSGGVPKEWLRRAVRRSEGSERLPTLGARHAPVHRVRRRR